MKKLVETVLQKSEERIEFYARPHPNPLPRGEGARFHIAEEFGIVVSIIASFNFIQSERKPVRKLVRLRAEQNGSPSPWGEGKGEGDRDVKKSDVRVANTETTKRLCAINRQPVFEDGPAVRPYHERTAPYSFRTTLAVRRQFPIRV